MKKHLIQKLVRLNSRIIRLANPFRSRTCCLCGRTFGSFMPYMGGWKAAPALMKALHMVGSDLDNFSCPACLSHDRERHLWLYLQASGLLEMMRDARILHFAPEWHLSHKIAAQNPPQYIKADLYPTAPDIQTVDLLAMPFADASFDFLIANHVMEHVDDDQQALGEICRVLKPGGWAILQTPYSASLQHTWEDRGIQTPQQRLVAYGQEDHVRLYGQDIFQRFAQAGFVNHVQQHAALLHDYPASRYGINADEPFMLFRKAA
jgi:SAM-dependent methyltransferase